MIRTVNLKNFQSHKDTTINLCKGVNIFIGASDAGKTAVIDALDWNINDSPKSDKFRSDWGGDTEVSIRKYDSAIIKRIRTDKDNNYTIHVPSPKDTEPKVFRNFSNDFPNEIRKILNFSEVNFQSQHDKHFMLSSTPGEAGRFLNKTVDLDIINTSQSKIKSEKETINKNLKYSLNSLESQIKKLDEFDDLDQLEELIEEAEELEKRVTKYNNEKDDLEDYLTTIDMYEQQLDNLPEIQIEENALTGFITLSKEIEELKNKKYDLEGQVNRIEEIGERIGKKRTTLIILNTDYKKMMGTTCPLCGRSDKK